MACKIITIRQLTKLSAGILWIKVITLSANFITFASPANREISLDIPDSHWGD